MKIKTLLLSAVLALSTFTVNAQSPSDMGDDEELNIGGDIFQDFNEDIEATQVMEDERFYRYARFFGVNIGIGTTTFTDNRGLAYSDSFPSYNFSLLYFMDFKNAFVLGVEFSKHVMIIDTFVKASDSAKIGIVDTSLLRPYIGFRYYVDTSDLGTAITYSTPYFVGRLEYWYQTNTFPELESFDDESGGGLGTSIGFGLEFPIEIKKTYLNIEFLYHVVNFFDKYTQDYREIPAADVVDSNVSEYGYNDLRGDVLSIMANYHIAY